MTDPPQRDFLTVLTSRSRLAAKRFERRRDGQILVHDYGRERTFAITERAVDNIHELSGALADLGRDAHSFIVRGRPIAGIDRERSLRRLRARTMEDGTVEPATLEPARHFWIPLDFDSLPCPEHIDPIWEPDRVVEHVVSMLPAAFEGATCCWSFTASHGVKPGLRLRLFFWTDRPLADHELKTWLAGHPVDMSIFEPIQPIYVAAPIFIGLADPVPVRSGLWRGDRDVVTPPAIVRPSAHARQSSDSPAGPSGTETGYQHYRAAIGDHDGGNGFFRPIKSAVSAFFWELGATGDAAWLRADLERAIREAPRDPAKHPDHYVETRVADLDRLIAWVRERQQEREDGQAEPVAGPSLPETGVSLVEGERLSRQAVDRFMARIEAARSDGPAPVMALLATLGIGKTRIAGQAIAALPPGSFANVYVTDHALGSEQTKRLTEACAGRHRVTQVFRREQDHPSGRPMCAYRDLARQIQTLGLSVAAHLCKRERTDGTPDLCREHPEAGGACPYQLQLADKGPAIRVAPHSYLTLPPAFNPLPPAVLTVIDESPVESFTRGGAGYGVRLDDIDSTQWLTVSHPSPVHVAAIQADFMASAGKLRRVLEQARPTPAMLRAAGLDVGACRWMRGICYEQALPLAVTPSMPRAEKERRIMAYRQQIALRMGRLWRLIEQVIDLDTDEIRPLRVVEGTDQDGRPIVEVVMSWSADPKVEGPVLILDGTADPEVLRRFWPTIEVVQIDVAPEHYHAVQIADRSVSKTMVGYNLDGCLKAPRADEERRARNNRAKLARLAELEATAGAIAVFTYKAVAEAMRLEHPHLVDAGVEVGFQRADGKWAGHYGAVRGLDRWGAMPTVILAGRLRPGIADLEQQARALFYRDPRPLTYLPLGASELPRVAGIIRMADGTGRAVEVEGHPDPLIAGLLDQIGRAELEQAIHRLRLVRRTADNPARVIILTNVPTSLPIHEITTWNAIMNKVDLATMLLVRGVVPDSWTGKASVLADMIEANDPANAVRMWFDRHPERAEAVAQALELRTFPYRNSIIGECAELVLYRYRVATSRQSTLVAIDTRHPDPRAAAERWLGPLDRFEPVEQAASEPATAAGPAPPAFRTHVIRDASGRPPPAPVRAVVHVHGAEPPPMWSLGLVIKRPTSSTALAPNAPAAPALAAD